MASVPAKRQRTEEGPIPVTQSAPCRAIVSDSAAAVQQPAIAITRPHHPASGGSSASTAYSQGNRTEADSPPMDPQLAIGLLDPWRSTPAVIYGALLAAARTHPDVARHLHELAMSQQPLQPVHGLGSQPRFYFQPAPAPAPAPAHTGAAPMVMSAPAGPVPVTSTRALQPLTQPSAPIPPTDSSGAPRPQPSMAIPKKQVAKPVPAPRPAPERTFTKLVKQAITALSSNRSPFSVQSRLEDMTASIAREVTPNASWATKKNAVTAIQDIVLAIMRTEGPIGRQLKNDGAYDFEVNFLDAVKRLSKEERVRLGTEDAGLWLRTLEFLKSEAKAYCIMGETLDEITDMVSPKS